MAIWFEKQDLIKELINYKNQKSVPINEFFNINLEKSPLDKLDED